MPSYGAAPTHSPTPERAVLVVDSGAEVNDLIDDVLTSEGWSIKRVADNQAVLSLVATSPFDLIITGAKTHGPEDLELLRKIRGVRPHQRLIILTEKWTPGDVIAAIREGAFSYLYQLRSSAALSSKWCATLWPHPVGMTASKSSPRRLIGLP